MKPKTSNEQGRASHPCAGCGGSGAPSTQPINWTLSRFVEHEDGTLSEIPGEPYMTPCPVCLGAGQFSDRMPARDAVADAGTLMNCLIAYGNPWKTRALITWCSWRLDDALDRFDVIRAARHAFAACPGLRG